MNKKKKNLSLFEEGDDEVQNADLPINKGYANRYENWRRLEEMQKIKDKYGDEYDEDSESSESEPEWTENHEEAFLKTLGALKSGDRSYFNNGKSYFKDVEETGGSGTINSTKKTKKDKNEKMTIRDYERKLVLEKGGQIDESDEEEEYRKTNQRGYHEEQEELRKKLASAIHEEEDGDEDLFTERKKTEKELKKDEDDFYEWMKSEEGKSDKTKSKELRHLKKFWKDDQLDDSEKFLRDYILNKDYEPGKAEENPTYEDIVALEEDEKEMDKNRQYERKYNFRFEDPDQEFIKQYPRTVSESMRTDANNRKEKRQEREERKKREKEERKKELKELQKMKKSEIEQKLAKLNKAAGFDIPLTLDELNEDFDPKEFDKKMQQIFNDDYYGIEENVKEDDDEKPVFSDMDSDYEDYDHLDLDALKEEVEHEEEVKEEVKEEVESDEDEEDEKDEQKVEKVTNGGKFDMIAAAKKAMNKDKQESQRKKKRNVVKEALARKKPPFNPNEKTFEEYFNEYYALDYEDIIGDQVTKFKYRDVYSNDFGLTTEEILEADERQLNAWASLKKVTSYRSKQEEDFDKNAYKRKAQDLHKKEKIFNTDFGGKKSLKRKAEEEEMKRKMEEEGGDGERFENNEPERKKKKKRGKKKPKVHQNGEDNNVEKEKEKGEEEEVEEQENDEEVEKEEEGAKKLENGNDNGIKKNKRTRNKNNKNKSSVLADTYGKGVTDSRVKAYGLNPNRLKKGLVYGSSKH